MMASGIGDLGAPGLPYWLLTGLPVCSSTAAWSKKSSALGVAMTCTVHPRSCASVTNEPVAVAGPAPHTMADRTRLPRSPVTGILQSPPRNAHNRAGRWAEPCWQAAGRAGGRRAGRPPPRARPPTVLSTSSSALSGSVTVMGGRRFVIRNLCLTISATNPSITASGTSANWPARRAHRRGRPYPHPNRAASPCHAAGSRSPGARPARLRDLLATTVRCGHSAASASKRPITSATHSAPGLAIARCSVPARTSAARPIRAGATPADRPKGAARLVARRRYRNVDGTARRRSGSPTCRPARIWPARRAGSGLAASTASRKSGICHTPSSHARHDSGPVMLLKVSAVSRGPAHCRATRWSALAGPPWTVPPRRTPGAGAPVP